MISSIKLKKLFNVFIMVGLLLMIPVLQNQVHAQYSGQPGAATLEEQLELAREKISTAQQQGAYGSGSANSQQNESKTFEDLLDGISFDGSGKLRILANIFFNFSININN